MTTCLRMLISALALATALSVRAADVVLRDEVIASGSIVRLGDVAVLHGDADEVARLAALPLMPAPAPGATHTLRAQSVRELLIAQGLDLGNLRFDGAVSVRIAHRDWQPGKIEAPEAAERLVAAPASPVDPPNTPGTFSTPSPVADRAPQPAEDPRQQTGFRIATARAANPSNPLRAISPRRREALQKWLADQVDGRVRHEAGESLIVSGIDISQEQTEVLALAQGSVSIRPLEEPAAGWRRFELLFETGQGEARMTVTAKLEPARSVVVATQSVPRGVRLAPSDLRLLRVAASAAPAGSIGSPEEAVGLEAARAIRDGQTVTLGDLDQPILVTRGELVTVVAGSGGIRVRMQGTARTDGRLGEMIEVEQLDKGGRLAARVTARGELAVGSLGDAGAARQAISSPTIIRQGGVVR